MTTDKVKSSIYTVSVYIYAKRGITKKDEGSQEAFQESNNDIPMPYETDFDKTHKRVMVSHPPPRCSEEEIRAPP